MMNNTAFQPRATTEKTAVIQNQLNGKFENDEWDLTDPFFETYGGGSSWNSPRKKITFNLLPNAVQHEFKFFFANQIVNEKLSLKTAFLYSSSFVHLSEFIKKYYQKITSIVEIPYNLGLMKYKTYLTNIGVKTTNKSGYNSIHITVFNSILINLYHFYDTRDEIEKDIWDLRKIPNARYTVNKTDYLLSFEKIPTKFRKIVKEYCSFSLTYLSQGHLAKQIRGIGFYMDFAQKNYPDWKDFSQLKRKDIEKYLIYFNQENVSVSPAHRYKLLSSVKSFFEYLQRSERSEAP